MVRGRTASCRNCQNRNSRDSSDRGLAVHNPIGRSSTPRHTSIRRTPEAPLHLPTIRRKRACLHQPTGRFRILRRPLSATSKACWGAGFGQKSRLRHPNVEIRRLHESCCCASAHRRRASHRLHGSARLRHVTRRLRASAISPPQAPPSRQTRTLRRAASFASH